MVLVCAILFFLWNVRGVLLPFILAWLIAVLLEPVVSRLSKGMPRPMAVLLISAIFFGSLIGIGLAVGPRVGKQISDVRGTVQTLATRLAEESADDNPFVRWNPAILAKPAGPLGSVDAILESYRPTLEQVGLPSTRRAFTAQYVDPYRENISATLQRAFNGFVGFVGGLVGQVVLLAFTPLFAILLMMDLEMFRRRFALWIPPSIRRDVTHFLEDVGDVFQGYLRGVMINIGLYMTVLAITLTALGAPYSYLLAVMAGCLYLIPNLGGIISVIVLFISTGFSGVTGNYMFTMSSSWAFAAVLAFAFFLVTTTWDLIITPRVVGGAVKLHPFVGMFVVFCGGALFGLPGMIAAYPVAGVVKVIVERVLNFTNNPLGDSTGYPAIPMRHRGEAVL